jgi:Pyruvate/2-oxoacid:ferredoxin oxidoreductase delta subunit
MMSLKGDDLLEMPILKNYQNIIFYFLSGTGNTYRVATWAGEVAGSQDAEVKVVPIDRADPETDIRPGPETLLGLFTSTHGFTAPWAMIRFVLGLPPGRGVHAFVSPSRGGTKFGSLHLPGFEGTAAYLLALILRLKGYNIRGVIGVDMPFNWTVLLPGFNQSNAESIIARAKPRVTTFIQSILAGERSFGFWTFFALFLGILILPISLGYLLIGRFYLSKLFFATEKCNGCAVCARNCPVGAIKMKGMSRPRPYWTFSCEGCMRCMNFCPEEAVEASHLLAVGLYFLISVPFGVVLTNWLAGFIPFLDTIGNALFQYLLQYAYTLFAFYLAYLLFNWLVRIPLVNKIFTFFTLTRFYRRYHEPGTNLKKMRGRR